MNFRATPCLVVVVGPMNCGKADTVIGFFDPAVRNMFDPHSNLIDLARPEPETNAQQLTELESRAEMTVIVKGGI